MPVINTNVSALLAQQSNTKNSRGNGRRPCSSSPAGSRINSAKDDAAGIAIGQSMTAQVRGLNQAIRNVNDGVNLAQTADGALGETANMLQRMRELAVQSASGTYSNTQRGYLQTEFTALASQIDKVASETTWNGMTVLTGTTGSTADRYLHLSIGSSLWSVNLRVDHINDAHRAEHDGRRCWYIFSSKCQQCHCKHRHCDWFGEYPARQDRRGHQPNDLRSRQPDQYLRQHPGLQKHDHGHRLCHCLHAAV